tara:strand:- start:189 stop:3290 length:3102 start_codon:yes stop_codon:yes gene_type:complete
MKTLKFLYTFVTIFVTLLFTNNLNAQCTHTFTGYDSWGDGWNGASVTITVNGNPVGMIAMATGTQESIQFQASDGDLIKLDWISGGYDSEISWDCTDGGNNTIAMGVWGTTTVGSGACPLPTPCATLDYIQDFESGTTLLTATTGAGSSVDIDGTSANSSVYGLHMQGNTSSGWGSSYSTGLAAFTNSTSHIASVSREICAPLLPTVTLTFNKMQTYTYNVNYSWFRVTVNGTPIADDNGNVYFNGSNNVWEPMKYDLSSYTGTAFVIAFETCNKYYTGYTSTGMGGDASYIDDILITQTSGLSPPSTPGTISGFDSPNAGGTETYTISPVSGASSYNWAVPLGYNILVDNGTSITVKTSSTDGNISVYASNVAGNSSLQSLPITTIETVTSYPYTTAFENETNDVTTASATGFTFNEVGWRNVGGDDGDWRTDAGGTSSTNSGPGAGSSSGQSDHYPGTSSGKYIYTEASTPNYPSKTFELWSPPYDLTSLNVPTLTFWYSLYSASGTSLSIQKSIDHGSTWSSDIVFMCPTVCSTADINVNMGTTWRQGFIDLSSWGNETNIMFRFKVVTGSSWDGDVCLDDIKLVDAQNTSVDVGENISLGTNSYSMAYGLILNGTSTQTITSNGYNISNITINNANGITLVGDLKVDGILTLTSGVITTGTDKVITAATPTGAISGGDNTSFINGNLRRYISSGTGTYTFPIGSGTGTSNYHRADLINGSLTGVSYIDALVGSMPVGSYANLNAYQMNSQLIEVFDKQWQLTPNSQPTGGTYGVNLYLNGVSGGFMQDDNFTIIKRDDNSITWADWGTYESTTSIPNAGQPGRTLNGGYGQKSGFTSFSLFGFGGTGGSALPIDLISFTGELVGGNVELEWVVASQINNEYFKIEKSVNCEQWEEIARIPGAGNSNTQMNYIVYDEKPYDGISYYRLSQTDYDGKNETFNPISIIYDKPIKLSINPNPVKEELHLYLEETLKGVTNLTIFNTKGQKVYNKSFIGEYKVLHLNVDRYKKGYYLLEVDHNQRKGTLKFIKE